MRRPLTRLLPLLLAFLALGAGPLWACFGAELRIAVEPGRERALAAYAVGYFVEEKTGIAPDFVETADPESLLKAGKVDLVVTPGQRLPSEEGADIPGLGPAAFRVRKDVADDLRYTTLSRALTLLPRFFSGGAYRAALSAAADPKKAARKAVSDAE